MATIKKTPKKAPTTLFSKQIKYSPKAHKLSIALNMASVGIDIPTADIVLRVFEKMNEMGGKFDLKTACKIRARVEEEYEQLAEEYKKSLTNKNK
jgi:hypothetical protein